MLPLPEEYLSRLNALTDISLSPASYNDLILRGDSENDHYFSEFDEEVPFNEDEPVTTPHFETQVSQYEDPHPESTGDEQYSSPDLADHYRELPFKQL